MIDWPDDLISDVARRKCVLYLGAGVSANSVSKTGGKHPATWKQFLLNILEKKKDEIGTHASSIRALIDKEDYLLACEVIVNIIESSTFSDLAAEEFRRPGYKPGEIHEIIYGLDSRIVITPNIDKIYDQCAMSNSQGTIVVKKYNDKDLAGYLRSVDYLIIKAHGCVDSPKDLVFTHEQYNKARYEFSSFYRLMDALLLTNTFIFIGCGINDPDIQLMLENCNFSFPNCRGHYFITEKDKLKSDIIDSLKKNRNLKIITYDNDDGSHQQLSENLKALSLKIEEERKVIADRIAW